MACDECGHPKKSHRYGSRNPHGKTSWLSSCRKRDCDCNQYV